MKHKIRFYVNSLLLVANRCQRRKQKAKKKDHLKPRIETLEDRLPVSSTFLTLAAAAMLGEGMVYDSNTASAEYSSEHTNASPESLTFRLDAMETALLTDSLDAFQVDRVFDEESQATGKASSSDTSLDFSVATTVFSTKFQADSSVDLAKQFGDDVLNSQISTLNLSQMPGAVSSSVAVPAAQTVSSATSSGGGVSNFDVMATNAQSTSSQANITARTSVDMGLTISDDVPENETALNSECRDSHDGHSYLDALNEQESATGYLPNVAIGENNGPMNSSSCCDSGCCNTAPYHTASGACTVCTCKNIIVYDADAGTGTKSINLSGYFSDNEISSTQLTYSVLSNTCGSTIVSASITGNYTLTLTFTGNGTVDSGLIKVTAADPEGETCAMTFNIYTVSVTGFTVEERAWGEGTGENGWHTVEDVGADWAVLWQENEYRWTPIVSGIPEDYIVYVEWHAVAWANRDSAGLTTSGQNKTLFATGGTSCGLGSGDNCGTGDPDPDDYRATGTPSITGEVAIIPVVQFDTEELHHYTSGSAKLHWTNKSPTEDRPKLGVTAIASVEWLTRQNSETRNPGTSTAADLAKLETDSDGYRTFPEQTSPTSPNYDKVEVRVTLVEAIPSGMTGSVYFKIFDPKNVQAITNPTVFLPNPDDNYGAMECSDGNYCMTFTSADSQYNGFYKAKGFQITSAHAGDNYIVATHPNAAGVAAYRFYTKEDAIATGCNSNNLPLNQVAKWLMCPDSNVTTTSPGNAPIGYSWLDDDLQTSVLTVWRTLWVELDQMGAPDPLIPEYAGMSQPPKPDISLVSTAMLAACVDVREATPAIIESWGINSRETVTFVDVIGSNSNTGYLDVSEDCRDIALAQVSESFWLVHGIGAYKTDGENNTGFASGDLDGGSFFVFRETITIAASLDIPFLAGGIEGQWARTTYHEIMHYFGFNDVYAADILEQLSLATGESLEGLIGLLELHDGRIYEFFLNHYHDYMDLLEYPTGGDPNQGIMDYDTVDFGMWEDIKLKPLQIVQIQQIAKPRPYSKPSLS
jgi:hypothetical protein